MPEAPGTSQPRLHRAEAPPEGYGVTSIHLRDSTLERSYTLDEFLECFPSVSKDLAVKVLERSEAALLAA